MTQEFANAYPRKRFFIEMFTRDISLEDCILDLIDNSIDALMRSKGIDVFSESFRSPPAEGASPPPELPTIDVSFSPEAFSVMDTCGGIKIDDAINDVFNFGHGGTYAEAPGRRQLGAYGIGLKRALFKIGRKFTITSRTENSGFKANLDLDEWSKKDDGPEDWRIPIDPIKELLPGKEPGTAINISKIRDDVKLRLDDGEFSTTLHNQISRTYSLFLERFVRVRLNGITVEPYQLPVGASSEVDVGIDRFEVAGVSVTLYASIAAPDPKGRWREESAGWYVMCNGRVVVIADRTELTGWGGGALPQYHSKYRKFLGLAFFEATDPLLLPWTTTKRSLNRESQVYLFSRNRMRGLARPILSFLDNMYPSEPEEQQEEREIASRVRALDVRELAAQSTRGFQVRKDPQRARKTTIKVQYDAEVDDIERIRRHLRKTGLSAGAVGSHTLDYFLRMEGLK